MIVLLVNKQKRRIVRARLLRVARAVMAAEGCDREAELSLAIGDDAWIRALNRKYKRRDRPTDVLAFPQTREPARAKSAAADCFAPAVGGQPQARTELASRRCRRPTSPRSPAVRETLLGDVAISAETAARQATEAGHSLMEELALLVTHGILHLTGWEDRTPAQRKGMMARARQLLGGHAETCPPYRARDVSRPATGERRKRMRPAKTS